MFSPVLPTTHSAVCQSLKTDSTTTLTQAPRSKGMVLRRRQADGDRFALSDCRRRVILSPVSRPADSVSSEGEPWCVVWAKEESNLSNWFRWLSCREKSPRVTVERSHTHGIPWQNYIRLRGSHPRQTDARTVMNMIIGFCPVVLV